MKTNILFILIAFFTLFGLGSCKKKDFPLTKVTPINLDSIAANFYEQDLKMHPFNATFQGDNRYNDLFFIDIEDDYLREEKAFLEGVSQKLKKVEYDKLPENKKIVYKVLDYTLKDRIQNFNFHFEYIPFNQFDGLPLYFPMMGSGEVAQPFKTIKDYEDWLKRMEKFPVWMNQAEINFRKGIDEGVVLPKVLVQKMIPQLKAEEIITPDMEKNIFYGPIKKFPSTFSDAEKEDFKNKYITAIRTHIIPAYSKMSIFLEKEYLPKARTTNGLNGIKKGKETYEYLVKSATNTNLTPEEVHAIGLQQVAILRSEMEKVKNSLGFSGSLEEFLRSLLKDPNAMPYKTAEEVLSAFKKIDKKIEPQLKKMFNTIPKTKFEIRQTEKFRELTSSAQYINGTPDGKRPGIFYIPLPVPKSFNVTSGMESLFLHEAIPGHHYQISLQQENTSLPKFMRFGGFNAYTEGWAHYCETLGPELGLYTDPYQKMGYYSDQMLRAVRLVIDTGIHTGKMNREEAIQYFMNNIAYEKSAAIAEVERYMAIPGQALGYKIGALKIRELRTKYEKLLGKKFSLAKFHDAILSDGSIPLSVLETKMEDWYKTGSGSGSKSGD